jgi:hypothetical protein
MSAQNLPTRGDWSTVVEFFQKDDEMITTEDRIRLFEAFLRLDSGLQERVRKYVEWHDTLPRSEAGQAYVKVLVRLMSIPLLAPDGRPLTEQVLSELYPQRATLSSQPS